VSATRTTFDILVEAWTNLDVYECRERLQAASFPAALPDSSLKIAVTHDPHLQALEWLTEVDGNQERPVAGCCSASTQPHAST